MLCPNCHAYAPSDAVRCPRCGMPVNLPDDGEKQEDSDLLSFRQGRHLAAHQQAPQPPKPQQRRRRNASRAMEEDMPDESSPQLRRPAQSSSSCLAANTLRNASGLSRVRAGHAFRRQSPPPAHDEQDGKENANVSGLLMLGNAYEANGELDKAEEVYAYLYTDIVPSASDAYRNQVRIYLAQGREKEAAELLAVAYKATGVTSFNTQRTSILPPTPGASVTAGGCRGVGM